MNKRTPNPWRAFAALSAIGLELALFIIVGFFAGRWLDSVTGTSPLFLVIGILIGAVLGLVNMILLIKRFLGDDI